MKLLFSISYYDPYISGLTICAARLAEHLSTDHVVSVITNRHLPSLPLYEKKQHITINRAKPLFTLYKGFISLDWIGTSWQQVSQHDVLIVNLPQIEGIIPVLCARLMGKKVITIVHCEVHMSPGLVNTCIETILSLVHLLIMLLSHQIVTYTEDYRNTLHYLPLYKHKVQCIFPPIPTPKIDKKTKQHLVRQIHGPVIIGVASRLASEKGIEYLLEAIPLLQKKIKHFKIAIAGPLDPVGEETYKQKIFQLVEAYKDYVVFLGSLSQQEIGAFYSLLDVLVLPSLNSTEAFGMVQVEAMLCGVPVVASNLPGVRIPIKKTGMGKIVALRDSQTIGNAILAILTHKDEYRKSKTFIRQTFSLEQTFTAYEKVIYYKNSGLKESF